MRAELSPRLLPVLAALLTGCALHGSSSARPWTPLPAYGTGLDASAGTLCGHGSDLASTSDTIAVDVLIDSLAGGSLTEVPVAVRPLPPEQRKRPTPVFGVTVLYPRPGARTFRESWHECDASRGATIRLNASTIGRAGLVIDAPGTVRVSIRTLDGTLLAAPAVLAARTSPLTIRWHSPPPAG